MKRILFGLMLAISFIPTLACAGVKVVNRSVDPVAPFSVLTGVRTNFGEIIVSADKNIVVKGLVLTSADLWRWEKASPLYDVELRGSNGEGLVAGPVDFVDGKAVFTGAFKVPAGGTVLAVVGRMSPTVLSGTSFALRTSLKSWRVYDQASGGRINTRKDSGITVSVFYKQAQEQGLDYRKVIGGLPESTGLQPGNSMVVAKWVIDATRVEEVIEVGEAVVKYTTDDPSAVSSCAMWDGAYGQQVGQEVYLAGSGEYVFSLGLLMAEGTQKEFTLRCNIGALHSGSFFQFSLTKVSALGSSSGLEIRKEKDYQSFTYVNNW